mgnify:CR=1 FL=1
MTVSRRDTVYSVSSQVRENPITNGIDGIERDGHLLRVSRSYGVLIVKIINIIDYYYRWDRWSRFFINLSLLAIGGSIAGILGIFVYIHVPSIPFTPFTPLSEIYTMILNSIPPHTGAIT